MSRTYNTEPHYVKLLRSAKKGYNSRKQFYNKKYTYLNHKNPYWERIYRFNTDIKTAHNPENIDEIADLINIMRNNEQPTQIVIYLNAIEPSLDYIFEEFDEQQYDAIINIRAQRNPHDKHIDDIKNLFTNFRNIINKSKIVKFNLKTNHPYIDNQYIDKFDDKRLAKIFITTVSNAIRDVNRNIHPNKVKLSDKLSVCLCVYKQYDDDEISDLPFDKKYVALQKVDSKFNHKRYQIIDKRNNLPVPVKINIPFHDTIANKNAYRCECVWCMEFSETKYILKRKGLPDDAELLKIKKEYNAYH